MPHFKDLFEETYLKTIFKLNNKQEKGINNITLAKSLQLNPATVLEMVRKLAERKLVDLRADKTIHLTEAGKKKALVIIRRHRLWEVFLADKLGYSWDEVHELAEELEHVGSEDLINRLEQYLGNPKADPHGDPIPDKKGRLRKQAGISVLETEKGRNYIVTSFTDTNDQFLQYLSELNIRPGTRVRLGAINEYDRSCELSIGKNVIHLSEKAASNILVEAV
jgi:DtxR family transcriptional regulator, Mn-dependent transcriptional regulator